MFCGGPLVAGEHDDVQTGALHAGDGLLRGRAKVITELEPSEDVAAVTDHHHASTGLSPKEHLLAAFLVNLEAKVQHHVQVPDGHGAIRCFTTDALAGLDDDVLHVRKRTVKVGP